MSDNFYDGWRANERNHKQIKEIILVYITEYGKFIIIILV